jgi:hypothetical protein
MELVKYQDSEITLKLQKIEFNFIREALRELPRALRQEELPTLTGYTREQVFDLADKLNEIAAHIGIDL